MAVPSSVTLGSLIVVFAAGVGLLVLTTQPEQLTAAHHAGTGVHSPDQTPSTTGPSPHPKATHTAPTTPTPTGHSTPTAVPNVLVVVYNNAGVAGLAASKASILEQAGWHVAAVDNWYGDIPESTVYYPPGMRPAAAQLAKVLDITRLHPAVSPMQFDRLTVILTSP